MFASDGEITVSKPPQRSFAKLAAFVDGGAVFGYGTSTGGLMPTGGAPPWTFVRDPATKQDARSRLDETNLRGIADQLEVSYAHRTAPGGLDDWAANLRGGDGIPDREGAAKYQPTGCWRSCSSASGWPTCGSTGWPCSRRGGHSHERPDRSPQPALHARRDSRAARAAARHRRRRPAQGQPRRADGVRQQGVRRRARDLPRCGRRGPAREAGCSRSTPAPRPSRTGSTTMRRLTSSRPSPMPPTTASARSGSTWR